MEGKDHLISQDVLLPRLEALAKVAVGQELPEDDYRLRLLNHSENTTYLVTGQKSDSKRILRVHRTGYHSPAAIHSELQWMDALREEAGVHTARILTGNSGERLIHVACPEVPEGRHCVFFEFLEGDEPDENDLLSNFPALGEITARMHRHVKGWQFPEGFTRFHWNLETILGEDPLWGHWYDGLNFNAERRDIIGRAVDKITERLTAFGRGKDRYNLVHADMRLANLLLHAGDTRVIDFDDSGFSWYLWDLATAVSFIEDRSDIPDAVQAWLEGYRRIQPLSQEDEDEIPTFIMLRRIQLVAWIGSHREVDLAQEMGDEFTVVSCDLAEKYLSRFS
jgi:Ser/Thr protein kinase RdoA (MazF antagonist)